MSGTKQKPRPIKKSTGSPSKKQSKSSKTQTSSRASTKTTVALKKTAGRSSEKQKEKESSSLSTWNVKGTASASSVQEGLQSVKSRSIENTKKQGDGWVKVTSKEHQAFIGLADELRRGRGRPRRDPSGVAKVEGLRLSKDELALITQKAKAAGFTRWRDWARKRLLEEDSNQAS
jgi:hypothetical protein